MTFQVSETCAVIISVSLVSSPSGAHVFPTRCLESRKRVCSRECVARFSRLRMFESQRGDAKCEVTSKLRALLTWIRWKERIVCGTRVTGGTLVYVRM